MRTFQSAAASAGSVAKRSGVNESEAVELGGDRVDLDGERCRRRRARLDQQGRAVLGERAQPLGHAGLVLHRVQRRAVEQLDRDDGRLLQARHGAARGLEPVEQDQRARLVGVLLDGLVGDLADEAERSFRADHQVGEDVDRVGEVDQRVQAVAGRVLEPELVADARGERRVLARRPRQLAEALDELGPQLRELGPARRVARVEHRAVGEDDAQAGERVVAVLRRAAAHAAGVVGGDAADHRGVDRGRIRADLPAQRSEPAIGRGADHARLERDRCAVGGDLDAAPAVAEHDQDGVADRLAGEARPGGAERHRRAQAGAAGEHAAKLGLVVDDDEELGNQAVEARVGSPREQAQRVDDEPLGRQEGGELLLELVVRGGQHDHPPQNPAITQPGKTAISTAPARHATLAASASARRGAADGDPGIGAHEHELEEAQVEVDAEVAADEAEHGVERCGRRP